MKPRSPAFEHIKHCISSNHKSILDIGCKGEKENGRKRFYYETLCDFYVKGNFERMIGLDKEKIISYDLIESLNECFKSANQIKTDSEILRKDFKYFKIHQADLAKSNIPLTENFDVIILSQILHFFWEEKRIEILKWCKNHLNEGGILFLRANHKENKEIPKHREKHEFNGEIFYSKLEGRTEIRYYLLARDEVGEILSPLIRLDDYFSVNESDFTDVYLKE